MTCDRFAHFPFFLGFYQIIAFVFSKSKAIVSACSGYASDPAPGCRSSKQSILRITGHASLEEHQLTKTKHTTPAADDFLRHWRGDGQRAPKPIQRMIPDGAIFHFVPADSCG
ncbi:hypothetical protein [Sinorhizobium chiapasense]|uniref:Secreted protein n=1 Tax=Sinorhizobium chiapasense TaxID=501572 RepID=A0ABZ2BGS9_9HYPH